MLSLFKEQEAPVKAQNALEVARNLLATSLNKGIIPKWDQFYLELPLLDGGCDLDEIKAYFEKLTQWSFLEDLLNLPATEFFFHGPVRSQYLKFDGTKVSLPLPIDQNDWQLWLEIISVFFRQNWNVEEPFASFYGELFGRKLRLSLVHGSTSPEGKSKLVIRCLAAKPHPLDSFGDTEVLKDLVKEKKNFLIAGSTGSGKTSLLSSLLTLVHPEDHLVILEDTYEISTGLPHETRFLAGSSPQTSLKSYLSYSLRLSPDRIILGEMRSHEVVPFLMAMNTGHKGLMGTLHASSAADALNRVALLFSLYSGEASLTYEKVMELLCRNLEYVVFMENKKVKEVIKVLGSEKGVPFFECVTRGFDGADDSKKNGPFSRPLLF